MKVEGSVTGSVRLERFVKKRRGTKVLDDAVIKDLYIDTTYDNFRRWYGTVHYDDKAYEVSTYFKKGDSSTNLPENRVWETHKRLSSYQIEVRLPISEKVIGRILEERGQDPTSFLVHEVVRELRDKIEEMVNEMFNLAGSEKL
jgi:hypothetical protein